MSSPEEVLKENPGDPAFVEYANHLLETGHDDQAMMVCLAGLSSNPGEHRGRLLLARIFFLKSFIPFAISELRILNKALPENEPIRKLLQKLSLSAEGEVGSAAPTEASRLTKDSSQEDQEAEEVTVAESDFDFDDLDLIMDEDS